MKTTAPGVGMNGLRYFLGASILVVGLLLKVGAPLVPVALGFAVAGFFTWKAHRSAR
jgi:hypothetical protein